jgi:hypothetical protein
MTLYEEVIERIDEVGEHISGMKDKKRLATQMPAEMYNRIKANAAYKNISIRTYVLRALAKELALDKDRGL